MNKNIIRLSEKDAEVIRAIESNELYGYIANNYWNMSKASLKDIILELVYAIDNSEEKGIILESVKEELLDRWDEGEPIAPPIAPFMGENMYIGGNIDEL